MIGPTDGIPTVRPNLGVIFILAVVGQQYAIVECQMPWPGEPLSCDRRDPVREVHQARRLTVPTKDLRIVRIVCELGGSSGEGAAPPLETHHGTGDKPAVSEQVPILYAITAEQAR